MNNSTNLNGVPYSVQYKKDIYENLNILRYLIKKPNTSLTDINWIGHDLGK